MDKFRRLAYINGQPTTRSGLVKIVRLRETDTRIPSPTAVEQADDELARFFEYSPDLLCIAGLDGYFKRLNPAWTSRLGWSIAELEARPFIDFVHPSDHATTLAKIDELSQGVDVVLFENRYRHRDGSYRWLRWNAHSMLERQQIYASARDVTKQKRLEREIFEVVDLERERLGRELHDGLCQTLAGIAALGSTVAKGARRSYESTISSTSREISNLLNQAIVEARSLARGLGPLGLNEQGLDATLETLAINTSHRFQVACTFKPVHPLCRLSPEVVGHLYRIAQEAANNAVTHGHAQRIEIELSEDNGEGLLSISDNGVGMTVDLGAVDGVGMHNMAYRTRLIGGTLLVHRPALGGTGVNCRFPLQETEDLAGIVDYEQDAN